jgi:hypothetical protein
MGVAVSDGKVFSNGIVSVGWEFVLAIPKKARPPNPNKAMHKHVVINTTPIMAAIHKARELFVIPSPG